LGKTNSLLDLLVIEEEKLPQATFFFSQTVSRSRALSSEGQQQPFAAVVVLPTKEKVDVFPLEQL
jgi:hypothetical protein